MSGYHEMTKATPRLETNLAPYHREMLLEESGIDPEIISERGYRTVRKRSEIPADFGKNQRRAPALEIPVYSPSGETFSRLRPDNPRSAYKPSNGRWVKKGTVKYEQPKGRRIAIDVHPRNRERVKDASVDLWVTEGEKKGDALTSRSLCTVDLSGVDCWGKDGELLSDWDHIALRGRTVYIVYDSDVMTKPRVQGALERLVGALEARGATVRVVYLPDAEDGSAQGVDDYLAAGGTIEGLYALARPFERSDYAQVRLSRDERLQAHTETLWAIWGTLPGKRDSAFTRRSVYRVLVEEAARRGSAQEDSVSFYLASNDGALRAGVSQPTFSKHARALEREGFLRIERPEELTKANRYVLLTAPRALGNINERRAAPEENVSQGCRKEERPVEEEGGTLSGVSSRWYSQVRAPEVPALRWSRTVQSWRLDEVGRRVCEADYLERLGKRREAVIGCVISSGGEATVSALMERFAGATTRPRDFKRRTLGRLDGSDGGPSIVAIEGDVVRLRDDWREALEDARELGKEQDAEHQQLINYMIRRDAFRNRNKNKPTPVPQNHGGDGWVEELEKVPEPPSVEELYWLMYSREPVETRQGAGRLWQVFGDQVGVVLDEKPDVVTFMSRDELMVPAKAS